MISYQIFWSAFHSMFLAIAKILLIAVAAGFFVRRNIISQENIKSLSEVTVKILLPSLVFSNVISTFNPEKIAVWWLLPLIGFSAPFVFMFFASFLFLPNFKQNLSKYPLAAFQNAGYLVLPIGQILYPENFDKFALYVFLLILGFNPALWSFGKVFITSSGKKEKFSFSNLLTPPLIANLLAISLVFLHLNHMPDIVFQPIKMLGSATIPIAMFILGATLGSISFRKLPKLADILKISFVKYIIAPCFTIVLLLVTKLYVNNSLMSDFLVIEASAAPAANLIVMVRKYGGDVQYTGSMMLIMYFEAVFFMPFCLALWKSII
jgi:hypothetical protein